MFPCGKFHNSSLLAFDVPLEVAGFICPAAWGHVGFVLKVFPVHWGRVITIWVGQWHSEMKNAEVEEHSGVPATATKMLFQDMKG